MPSCIWVKEHADKIILTLVATWPQHCGQIILQSLCFSHIPWKFMNNKYQFIMFY